MTASKPSDDHPWKATARNRPAPSTHPWRKRFNPLPFDAETTEAMKRQIEFQRREGVLDAVITGYTPVNNGYRRDPVHYDEEGENS